MLLDGKEVAPAIYLVISKENKVVAFSSVNVPDALLIREQDEPALYAQFMREGCACLADPTCNHVISLGVK